MEKLLILIIINLYRLSPNRESKTVIDTQFEMGFARIILVKIQSVPIEIQDETGVSATHLDWTMIPYVRKSFYKHYKNGLKYINESLNPLYKEFTEHFLKNGIFAGYSEKLNKAIYDNICSIVKKRSITVEDVKDIEKSYIIQGIESKAEDIIFKQPIIVLIYYLAKNYGNELEEIWDSSDSILETIYCDLGISFDS